MPRILRLPYLRLGEDVGTLNHLGSLQAFHVLSGHKPSGLPFQQLVHGALLPGRGVLLQNGAERAGPIE